jgi:hypothetical protein
MSNKALVYEAMLLMLLSWLVTSCTTSGPSPYPFQKTLPANIIISTTNLPPTVVNTKDIIQEPICSDFNNRAAIADSFLSKVVFQKDYSSIELLDIVSMQEKTIAKVEEGDHRTDLMYPVIFENWIAWAANYGPEEQQVFVRNILTEDNKRITSEDTLFATQPSVYGKQVAWSARFKDEKYVNHLLIYDLDTNQTREIKINTGHDTLGEVRIWNDWLAVTAYPNDSSIEVVVLDLKSRKETILPNSSLANLQGDTLIYREPSNSKEACTYNILTQERNCFAYGLIPFMDISGVWVVWSTLQEKRLSLFNLANHQPSSFTYEGTAMSINDLYLIWNKDDQICYMPMSEIK